MHHDGYGGLPDRRWRRRTDDRLGGGDAGTRLGALSGRQRFRQRRRYRDGRGTGRLDGRGWRGWRERSHRRGDSLLNGLLGFLLVNACDFKRRAIEREIGQFLLGQQVFHLFSGGEFGVHRVIEVGYELAYIDGGGGHTQRLGNGGDRRNAVVGRERDPDVRQTAGNILVQPGEERVQLSVEAVYHLARLGRVRSEFVAHQVVGGKAKGQHVGDRMAAQLLVGDERPREIKLV